MQFTAVFTWENQGVNFLSECSAFVGFDKLFVRWNQYPEQFQDSQQTQESQEAKINGDERLKEEGQNCDQINQRKWAGHVSSS